jgi:hypothetical protein
MKIIQHIHTSAFLSEFLLCINKLGLVNAGAMTLAARLPAGSRP